MQLGAKWRQLLISTKRYVKLIMNIYLVWFVEFVIGCKIHVVQQKSCELVCITKPYNI